MNKLFVLYLLSIVIFVFFLVYFSIDFSANSARCESFCPRDPVYKCYEDRAICVGLTKIYVGSGGAKP